MARFSASDAALTGFRIVRERPLALAIWAGIQLILTLGAGLSAVRFAGPALMSLHAASSTGDPALTMAIFQRLEPYYLCLLAVSLIFYPILYATMNRAVLRPGEEGFGYIRVGADELRQLGLLLLIVVFGIVACVALIIAAFAVATPLALALAFNGKGSTTLSILLTLALGLAVVALWIYVWVRLSLASPLTFATRKIDLFGSWRLTRGLFWPMFGAYLVAAILALMVFLLTVLISLAVSAAIGGGMGGLSALFHHDMTSLAAYLTPGRLVSLVFSALSWALVWPILLTPAAAIYRALNDSPGEAERAAL